MQCLIFLREQAVVSRLAGFACDKRGVSAIEFALILPLMLLLFLGMVEVSQGIIVDRKVKMTARTVADLVSQVSKTDNSGVDAALGASTAILAPFPAVNAHVIVSGVSIDNNGNAKVVWSRANKDAGHGTGDSVTVPDALKTPNAFLVWGEATYDYVPTLGYVTGPMRLSNQIFIRPRVSKTVSCCS